MEDFVGTVKTWTLFLATPSDPGSSIGTLKDDELDGFLRPIETPKARLNRMGMAGLHGNNKSIGSVSTPKGFGSTQHG